MIEVALGHLPRRAALDRHHEEVIIARFQIAAFVEAVDERIDHRDGVGPFGILGCLGHVRDGLWLA